MVPLCAHLGGSHAAAWLCVWLMLAVPLTLRAGQDAGESSDFSSQNSQNTPTSNESSAGASASLPDRQRAIRERLERLQNRMLELARQLEATEPAKSERLRDTLDMAGKQRLAARLDALVQQLQRGDLSDADREQAAVLTDMKSLLELLSSSLNELDRLREERERLEQIKRRIHTLMDEQLEMLYRTQHAGQQLDRAADGPTEPSQADPTATPNDQQSDSAKEAAEMLQSLEQMQRDAQRRAAELGRDMQPKSSEAPPTPGAEHMQQAQDHMQQAADELGGQDADSAEKEQGAALSELQQTLDQLDDTLRQKRQEEREETLAALETRLRGLLEREQRVRDAVVDLQVKAAGDWSRFEELRATETAELQRQAVEDARTAVRILVDEGSTVIIPELMQQVVDDMADVADRLGRSDVSEPTKLTLDDVIAVLEEILAAIEQQRDKDADADSPQPPQQGQQQNDSQSKPLLPESAELKLMRSMQVRLNDRTVTLQKAMQLSGEDATLSDSFRGLAERQLRLAEQARRLNEKK